MVPNTLSTFSSPSHTQGVVEGKGSSKLSNKGKIEGAEYTVGILKEEIEHCKYELSPRAHRAWSVKWLFTYAQSILDRGGLLARLVRLVARFCAGCSAVFKQEWQEQERLRLKKRALLYRLKVLERTFSNRAGQVGSTQPKSPRSRLEELPKDLKIAVLSFLSLKDQSRWIRSSRSLEQLAPVVDHLIVPFEELLTMGKVFQMTRLLSVWINDPTTLDLSSLGLGIEKIRHNFPRVRYLCLSGKPMGECDLRKQSIQWDLVNDQEVKEMEGDALRVTQLVLLSPGFCFAGVLKAIAQRSPHLRSVTSLGGRLFNDYSCYGKEDLLGLAEYGEKLKELRLRDLTAAAPLNLELVIRQCKAIRTLSLENCRLVPLLDALEQGGQQLSDLELIEPRYDDGVTLGIIAQRCSGQRELKRFSLHSHSFREGEGDRQLQAIAKSWPQLQELYLNCYFDSGTLTGQGLEALAQGCRQLRALRINAVTEKALRVLSTEFSQLTWLCIGDGDRINDEGAKLLAQKCSKLTYLRITACQRMSDEGLRSIAEGCQQLTALRLAWCLEIGDRGVEALASNCPQLTSLSLKYTKMTDRALAILVDHRISLSELSLKASNVTHRGLPLLKGFPNMMSLTLHGSCIKGVDPKSFYSWLPRLNRLELSVDRKTFCVNYHSAYLKP